MSRPLQIVSLRDDSVEVNDENVQLIADNLRALGCERVSVLSCMGAYRTGKSFLLDLALRFLRHHNDHAGSAAGAATRFAHHAGPQAREDEPALDSAYPTPAWVTGGAGGAPMHELSEVEKASSAGFYWRGGEDRCTEGIWMWSEPFIRVAYVDEQVPGEDGDDDGAVLIRRRAVKVGLLLMDTQGAFDSATTKEQLNTIFGLTTILSSHVVLNLSNRLSSDVVSSLHFFAEMALAAVRCVRGGGKAAASGGTEKAPFQKLTFLVRDWVNFDDDDGGRWSESKCRAAMAEHLEKHTGAAVPADRKKEVEAVKSLFQQMDCFLLPSPGRAVAESHKRRWAGDFSQVDGDFLRFVDLFLAESFAALEPKRVLGDFLSPKNFGAVITDVVKLFPNLCHEDASLVDAFAKSSLYMAADQAEETYVGDMRVRFVKNKKFRGGKDEQLLEADHGLALAAALEAFSAAATFGDAGDISTKRDEVMAKIADLWARIAADNRARLESALAAYSSFALVGSALFVVDRASDYTCDWWLDACVKFSTGASLVYYAAFSVIAWQAFSLYRERGGNATLLALVEMSRACCKESIVLWERARRMSREEWVALAHQAHPLLLASRLQALLDEHVLKGEKTNKQPRQHKGGDKNR